MELTLLLFSATTAIVIFKLWTSRAKYSAQTGKSPNSKSVPIVTWCLPYFGHGLWIALQPQKFLQYCYTRYGAVFQIQIFSRAVVIVSDNSLIGEICRSVEGHLSFYKHLENIFIGDSNGLKLSVRASIIKKATVRMGSVEITSEIQKCVMEFITKIGDNASSAHIAKTLKRIDLKDEIFKFVIQTTSRCLLGVEFSSEMIQEFMDFAIIQTRAALAARVIPTTFAKFLFSGRLGKERAAIWTKFKKKIQQHRQDGDLRDSPVIRWQKVFSITAFSTDTPNHKFQLHLYMSTGCCIHRAAVDVTNDKTGLPISDHEICCMLMGLLFASTGNTTLCILHTLLELSKHTTYLEPAVREAKTGNMQGILNSNYLNSCILEAARLNTNIILVERTPDQKKYIGDYYIGDCDVVAIAGTLNHVDGTAKTLFPSPNVYNPARYLDNKRLYNHILSWGAGVHACSGRLFAIGMTKVLVANFLNVYKIDLENSVISRPNFKCPTAFVDLKVYTVIEKRLKESSTYETQ